MLYIPDAFDRLVGVVLEGTIVGRQPTSFQTIGLPRGLLAFQRHLPSGRRGPIDLEGW